MKGILIKKAEIVSEDDRRIIIEIMNGQMAIKNMKILKVKKGEQLLGNHWHPYGEVMYMLQGKARYRMKNLDTNEQEDFELVEGDVVFRTGRITHAGYFSEDSIVVDGACEPYVSQDFNDMQEKIL
jgi:hypothetical protein